MMFPPPLVQTDARCEMVHRTHEQPATQVPGIFDLIHPGHVSGFSRSWRVWSGSKPSRVSRVKNWLSMVIAVCFIVRRLKISRNLSCVIGITMVVRCMLSSTQVETMPPDEQRGYLYHQLGVCNPIKFHRIPMCLATAWNFWDELIRNEELWWCSQLFRFCYQSLG